MINLFGSPAGRALNTKSYTEQSYNNVNNLTTANTNIPNNHYKNSIESNDLNLQNHLNFENTMNSNDVLKSKRNSILKPNLFTKKTKFWKFLEDDKSKKNSIEDISTASSGQSRYFQFFVI